MTSKQSSGPVKAVLGIAVLACLLFGAFLTATGAYFVWKGFETKSWSVAPGTIDISRLETEVRHTSNRSGSSLVDVAKLGYYFSVQSQHYRGDRVSTFDLRLGRNTSRARALLEKYPLGAKVQVSYDPRDPNRSVLEPGVKNGALKMVGLGLLLIAIHLFLRRLPLRIIERPKTTTNS